MKVLYVLKRYPQTSQTFVIRELLGLERAGVDIGIDSLGPSDAAIRHPEVDEVKAAVRHLPKRPQLRDVWPTHLRLALRRPVVYIRAARAARSRDWRRFVQAGLVAGRVRREGIDHLHAHFASAACEVARDAAALAGVTYSVTAHAKDVFHDKHAGLLAERVEGAATVVTVSAHNAEHLRTVLPTANVVHVANAVALPMYSGPSANGPVLCVARLVAKKGIDTLIQSISDVRLTWPDVMLEIIGDGELREELEALADRLGLGDNVRFVGAVDSHAVSEAYARASMMVLPCRVTADGDRDGLPTVLVEALACGLPVISTNVVGIPELVRHERTGLLVEPDDPGALSNAILKLHHDAALARDLGERGRDLVATDYDPATSARALAAVFTAGGAR